MLEVKNLKKYFSSHNSIFRTARQDIKAVDNVSFTVEKGETLALVGESGCGKSTLGRTILRLYEPTEGQILFKNNDISGWPEKKLKTYRQKVQMIFQDPYASLNPRMSVGKIIAEPIEINKIAQGKAKEELINELLTKVGLKAEYASHFPHEFSGGQRQRIAIARALAVKPEFIVCDEPVSALDISVRAQVLNILKELQEKHQLTYLFISHDLSIVRYVSDRTAVMYFGKIVELADTSDIYRNCAHPYTRALLSAIPIADPEKERRRKRIILQGELPISHESAMGCRFYTRCWLAKDICKIQEPEFREIKKGHSVSCHYADNM